MQKYDVITFGSASEDIFVFSKEFFNKKLCFPIGDKIEMDKIIIRTGGGGINAATTFALQGIKTAYCGSAGKDYAGSLILLDLERDRISTEFLSLLDKRTTNHSVVISKKEKGKVILVYRNASNYPSKDFNLKKMNADWFYLAPLGGEFAKKTKQIINFANKNKIKVAFNPSKEQIQVFKKEIKTLLPKIDVLTINRKEAIMLFGNYRSPEEVIKKIRPYLKGIISIGERNGVITFDSKNIYRAGLFRTKVTDTTGGGDASGAGFVAGLIKTGDIVKAIQLSRANVAACLKEWGAKEGLLRANQKYQKITVKIFKL